MSGWEQPLPQGVGRGVSLQFVFASYMAHVAEVEVSKDGEVRVRRVVCAVDCGSGGNPDTVRAPVQSARLFGVSAALFRQITLKGGPVQQTNLHTHHVLPQDGGPPP